MSDQDDDRIPETKLTQADIDAAMEMLSKPRERAKPGDPFYEIDQIINRCFYCKKDKDDKETDPCHYCKPRPRYPDNAPDGQIFVCGACGKTSKCIYGDSQESFIGWDESCMLNAVLCYEDKKTPEGHWMAVEGY
jgi:hypothetical protein